MARLDGARRSVVTLSRHIFGFYESLFQKCDPTALSIFRILFGFLMALDVPQERGLEEADLRFGDPNYCFFPLFSFIQPMKLSHACIAYSIMWMGSLGIMLGVKFRLSCFLYGLPYFYFFLLDKSRWNNHSYLFGLILILFSSSDAGKNMSLDNYFARGKRVEVPKWNYFMLKFQLFILYFYAAVKKIDSDWLCGYSMKNLTQHWIFDPMKLLASSDTIEFYMIHLGGFIYDLSVGFLLNIPYTKKLAFLLSFMFHWLNSQIFTIGMFPYVCLASLVLFCEPHEFPVNLFSQSQSLRQKFEGEHQSSSQSQSQIQAKNQEPREKNECPEINSTSTSTSTHSQKSTIVVKDKEEKKRKKKGESKKTEKTPDTKDEQENKTQNQNQKQETVIKGEKGKKREDSGKRWWKFGLMLIYMLIQILLPFTHPITKGYNNWTHGLYGYSWDMMVHSWSTLHIKVTVVDKMTGTERYLDPDAWTTNDRWSSHADMAKQYGQCIARNLANYNVAQDISIHLDVWKSLNGRFQQRVFDPRVDILKAPWSPWEEVSWVLPLLTEYSNFRRDYFDSIIKNVANWTLTSNVIFVADFPGLFLENYMPLDLANVSVTLMRGDIVIEQQQRQSKGKDKKKFNTTLSDSNNSLQTVSITTGDFHRIYTVSPTPSCYMYTYTNATMDKQTETENNSRSGSSNNNNNGKEGENIGFYDKFVEFLQDKFDIFSRSFYLIINAYMNVLFDCPMIVRRTILN